MKLEWIDVKFNGIPRVATRVADLLFVVFWTGGENHDIVAYHLSRNNDTPGDLLHWDSLVGARFHAEFAPTSIASGAGAAIYNYLQDEAKRLRNRAAEIEALL